jgi:ferrous-iron efflux pump FieF
VRYAAAPPDAEHRFGHGKAEALASLVQSALVFVSALLIVREAVVALLHPQPLRAEGPALMVMGLSILLTLGLVTLQSRALKRVASVAVAGDRAHYASDLASNLVSLLGIGFAALTGLGGFDVAAGVIVAGVLAWSATGVLRQAADQLLDREMADEDRARILDIVRATPGIEAVSELRTRVSGPHQHMQLRAQFAADCSLEEAHTAILSAEHRLLKAFPAADILIHPDPGPRAPGHEGVFTDLPSEI